MKSLIVPFTAIVLMATSHAAAQCNTCGDLGYGFDYSSCNFAASLWQGYCTPQMPQYGYNNPAGRCGHNGGGLFSRLHGHLRGGCGNHGCGNNGCSAQAPADPCATPAPRHGCHHGHGCHRSQRIANRTAFTAGYPGGNGFSYGWGNNQIFGFGAYGGMIPPTTGGCCGCASDWGTTAYGGYGYGTGVGYGNGSNLWWYGYTGDCVGLSNLLHHRSNSLAGGGCGHRGCGHRGCGHGHHGCRSHHRYHAMRPLESMFARHRGMLGRHCWVGGGPLDYGLVASYQTPVQGVDMSYITQCANCQPVGQDMGGYVEPAVDVQPIADPTMASDCQSTSGDGCDPNLPIEDPVYSGVMEENAYSPVESVEELPEGK
ncbi:MAG: hypothetical protein AAF497_15115 [Planctomycetota bacterium]